MNAERGQAQIFAVAVAALAAIAISGTLAASDRLLARAHAARSAEAAVEAGGAYLADRHLGFVRERGAAGGSTPDELGRFLNDPLLERGIIDAALAVAVANGGPMPIDAATKDAGREISLELTFGDRTRQLVTIEKVTCCPR